MCVILSFWNKHQVITRKNPLRAARDAWDICCMKFKVWFLMATFFALKIPLHWFMMFLIMTIVFCSHNVICVLLIPFTAIQFSFVNPICPLYLIFTSGALVAKYTEFYLFLWFLQPASGTKILGKDVVICKYPSDPTVVLGYLSLGFLIVTTVAGYLSLFYPYKGKSIPQGTLFRSGSFAIFFNIAV